MIFWFFTGQVSANGALNFYTLLNSDILAVIASFSQAVSQATVSRLLLCYWACAAVKENAGLERALGTTGVAQKGTHPPLDQCRKA